MDLTIGDIVIFSGDGVSGTWERYEGARTAKAIRSRLSRDRCGGDRFANVWIELAGVVDSGLDGIEHKVYGKLGADLDSIDDQRGVRLADVRSNPAAALAAKKRGRSSASAANGAKGGRPMKRENVLAKLTADGFVARLLDYGVIEVSIFDDQVHQSEYARPCAEAVVLPLLGFCARYNLTMRRNGAICEVRA